VVELDVGRHELGLRHTCQQDALAGRLDGNQHALGGVFNRQPLAGAEVEEAEFIDGRIKVLHAFLHAVLMRSHIDGARLTGPHAEFP